VAAAARFPLGIPLFFAAGRNKSVSCGVNSNQEYARDHAACSLRFAIPTVVNGRVYVGAKYEVDVYGLLPAGKK
jgi:hypothetical protein